MRQLPPFPELVAFEAVARLRSFTRAAAELCLTQSAVSHRVRRLEKHFGEQLIRRLNPGLTLTDAGAALLPELQTALESLAALDSRTGRGRRERRLRVAAGSALCTWWLAGRLAKFMKQRPGISVELVPIENDGSSVPEVDVRILWVSDAEFVARPTQAPLFNEHVFPVCSPQFAQLAGGDTAWLTSAPLLHKTVHASGEWSWDVWLERVGVARQPRGGQLRFADMGLILSAAVEGSGIALARSLLAYDALADGRLVVPALGVGPMTSTKKHVARWRRGREDDQDIAAFVAWLVAEAEATLAAAEPFIRPLAKTGPQSERSFDVRDQAITNPAIANPAIAN